MYIGTVTGKLGGGRGALARAAWPWRLERGAVGVGCGVGAGNCRGPINERSYFIYFSIVVRYKTNRT